MTINIKTKKYISVIIGLMIISVFYIGLVSYSNCEPLNTIKDEPSSSLIPIASSFPNDSENLTLSNPNYWIISSTEENPGRINIFIDNITWIGEDGFLALDIDEGDNLNLQHLIDISIFIVEFSNGNDYDILGADVLTLTGNATDGYWTSNVSMKEIPEGGNYVIMINITANDYKGFITEFIGPVLVNHEFTFDFVFNYIEAKSANLIISSTYSSFKDGSIDGDDITEGGSVKYMVKNNENPSEELASGVIVYDSGWSVQITTEEDLNENSFIVLEFDLKGFNETIRSPDTYSEISKISNAPSAPESPTGFFLWIIIGVVAGVLILGGIFLYVKKQETNLDRGNKQNQDEIIEIVDFSKASLNKTKLSANKQPTKKAKNIDKGDLIFDVPTWEIDEDEEEEEVLETSTTKDIHSAMTLHCPGCNSWYEVDEFEKMNCPKCKNILEVAMWCGECTKWFDVPEPTGAVCPICNQKLAFSK